MYSSNALRFFLLSWEGAILDPVKHVRTDPTAQRISNLTSLVAFCGDLPPSSSAKKARMRKGADFPTNSYITLPKGAPAGKAKQAQIPKMRTGTG